MPRFVSVLCAMVLCLAAPVVALDAPEGRAILTVTGNIAQTNDGDAARFDRALLERLDWQEIETHTSFTTGPQRFAGPTLASLLDAVEFAGNTLKLTALNGYEIRFPAEYAFRHGVILALDHDGRAMSVREKGPIWVVFPLDRDGAEDKRFDGEMIWQLSRLHVTD
ncbi:oxidoreductase [Litorisediminicola beolgyonensis]|uniref:Oxidoreductase n=1 Tax=Litorisediminicola beolgyonensis TaxID=1173614 RepID=A0ABW3ZMH3_9RHOB